MDDNLFPLAAAGGKRFFFVDLEKVHASQSFCASFLFDGV